MCLKGVRTDDNIFILNTIINHYNNCIFTVETNKGIAEHFESITGVKQGCNLSPLLSNLYQNDLHSIFDDSCDPFMLGTSKISSLSWADDLVLFSTSLIGLQNCLSIIVQSGNSMLILTRLKL